jgi:hypothetical protein
MGRNSLHLLVSPPTILTDAPQLLIAQSAKGLVTSAKILVITNAKDAFGLDPDI